jgi:hypothetical protein
LKLKRSGKLFHNIEELVNQGIRIKQLELELDESAKDREILQQEIKTALEINIENAKQFEKQVGAQPLLDCQLTCKSPRLKQFALMPLEESLRTFAYQLHNQKTEELLLHCLESSSILFSQRLLSLSSLATC